MHIILILIHRVYVKLYVVYELYNLVLTLYLTMRSLDRRTLRIQQIIIVVNVIKYNNLDYLITNRLCLVLWDRLRVSCAECIGHSLRGVYIYPHLTKVSITLP